VVSGPDDRDIPRLGGVSADEDGDPADAPDATLVQVPADRERLFGGEHGGGRSGPDGAWTDAMRGFGAMGAEDGTLMQRPNTVPFMQPLPAAGRPAYAAYASAPQAPSSDRVLLPPQGEPARAAVATGPAPMPPWVFIYLFGAVLLALAGGIILFVESRILGHL
jgi:hypothetical protein